MATWGEFVSEAPDVGAAARAHWPGIAALDRGEPPSGEGPMFAIAYLGTTRPDGSPRVHPFCPIIAGGGLFAAIPSTSPKGDDLRRDGRCVIHALPGPDDAELCIRAHAHEVVDGDRVDLVRAVVARSGVGGMIETTRNDPLFEFGLERVDVAVWVDVGRPGTYARRSRWVASE